MIDHENPSRFLWLIDTSSKLNYAVLVSYREVCAAGEARPEISAWAAGRAHADALVETVAPRERAHHLRHARHRPAQLTRRLVKRERPTHTLTKPDKQTKKKKV